MLNISLGLSLSSLDEVSVLVMSLNTGIVYLRHLCQVSILGRSVKPSDHLLLVSCKLKHLSFLFWCQILKGFSFCLHFIDELW